MFLLKTCDREFVCPKAYPSCAFIPIPAKIPIKILSTLHSNFNIVKNLEFFLFCPFFVYSPRIAGGVVPVTKMMISRNMENVTHTLSLPHQGGGDEFPFLLPQG